MIVLFNWLFALQFEEKVPVSISNRQALLSNLVAPNGLIIQRSIDLSLWNVHET